MPIDDFSPEAQRERGKKNLGKTKGFFLSKKRKCNSKCPLLPTCRYHQLSVETGGRCALANSDKIPDKQKHRIVKFLIGGQSDQIELMREIALNIDLIADKKSVKELKELLTSIGYVYEKEFGRVEKIEHSGAVEGIVINIVRPDEVVKPKTEDKE